MKTWGFFIFGNIRPALTAAGEDIFHPLMASLSCAIIKNCNKTDKNAILADKVCGKGIIQGQLVL